MAVTDPGAWEPAFLQQRFPDAEPWMVENDAYDLKEEEAEDYIASLENIHLLCPRCGKYPLRFEIESYWD